jgi:anti-sigma-K factor RskA
MDPHDRFAEDLGAYVLGVLPAGDRAALEAHLSGCAACTAELRRLAPVPAALARSVPQVDPPAALRARVLSSVASVHGDVARPDAAAPAVRRGSPALMWLPVAASLLLAVVSSAYAWRLSGRMADLERGLADANARALAGEARLVEVRRTVDDAQSAVTILTSDDVVRVTLAGLPTAPGATARAFVSASRGVLFTGAGLPPPPSGRVYQLWVVTPQQQAISAGLVTADSAGRVNHIFNSPVGQPFAVAVTDEPPGGSTAPTGSKHLIGLAPASTPL